MPKRPLSAYNLFFKAEREKLLLEKESSSSTKVDNLGFETLAQSVALSWRSLDPKTKAIFVQQGQEEKRKYVIAVKDWKLSKEKPKTKRKTNARCNASLAAARPTGTGPPRFFASNGSFAAVPSLQSRASVTGYPSPPNHANPYFAMMPTCFHYQQPPIQHSYPAGRAHQGTGDLLTSHHEEDNSPSTVFEDTCSKLALDKDIVDFFLSHDFSD